MSEWQPGVFRPITSWCESQLDSDIPELRAIWESLAGKPIRVRLIEHPLKSRCECPLVQVHMEDWIALVGLPPFRTGHEIVMLPTCAISTD